MAPTSGGEKQEPLSPERGVWGVKAGAPLMHSTLLSHTCEPHEVIPALAPVVEQICGFDVPGSVRAV